MVLFFPFFNFLKEWRLNTGFFPLAEVIKKLYAVKKNQISQRSLKY